MLELCDLLNIINSRILSYRAFVYLSVRLAACLQKVRDYW